MKEFLDERLETLKLEIEQGSFFGHLVATNCSIRHCSEESGAINAFRKITFRGQPLDVGALLYEDPYNVGPSLPHFDPLIGTNSVLFDYIWQHSLTQMNDSINLLSLKVEANQNTTDFDLRDEIILQ